MKKQLKDVCEGFTKNIAQKDLSENNGKYPIFGASGIIKTIDFYISDKPYIGIVKDGSGVGRTNKYPAKSSLLGTMQYILPNQGIDLDYLMYGIRFLHLGENYSGAAIPHIYFKVYKNRTLDFPELAEQKHRSIVLNKIQDAINVKEKQLFELENIIQSEFVEMFGENPVESGKWKVEKLGDCGTFKNGMNYSPSENGVDILCLNVSDFKDNYKIQDCKTLSSISLNEEPSSEYYLQNDDIVFVRSNGNKKLVGRCVALYPNDCKVLFSGFCIRFRKSTDNLNTDFLLHFLKTDLTREQLKGKGANIQNLNQQILANLHLPVPPLDLQNQFAAFVQKIDKSKFVLQQQLQFIKKYVIMTSWRKICFYTTVAM